MANGGGAVVGNTGKRLPSKLQWSRKTIFLASGLNLAVYTILGSFSGRGAGPRHPLTLQPSDQAIKQREPSDWDPRGSHPLNREPGARKCSGTHTTSASPPSALQPRRLPSGHRTPPSLLSGRDVARAPNCLPGREGGEPAAKEQPRRSARRAAVPSRWSSLAGATRCRPSAWAAARAPLGRRPHLGLAPWPRGLQSGPPLATALRVAPPAALEEAPTKGRQYNPWPPSRHSGQPLATALGATGHAGGGRRLRPKVGSIPCRAAPSWSCSGPPPPRRAPARQRPRPPEARAPVTTRGERDRDPATGPSSGRDQGREREIDRERESGEGLSQGRAHGTTRSPRPRRPPPRATGLAA
ncbi:protein transport protein SEC31-like [Panicum virgatum]|uniref:protein transport protein SEC31-like n=1 Tax=Panicum virgatum TaxID=38727 RepID=UPI0019D60175|nr:protein transport protein SEC31-like [Panicum virgatum]